MKIDQKSRKKYGKLSNRLKKRLRKFTKDCEKMLKVEWKLFKKRKKYISHRKLSKNLIKMSKKREKLMENH